MTLKASQGIGSHFEIRYSWLSPDAIQWNQTFKYVGVIVCSNVHPLAQQSHALIFVLTLFCKVSIAEVTIPVLLWTPIQRAL